MTPERTGGITGEATPEGWSLTGYLPQLDLYRMIACACVVGQHAILWPVTASSTVGWGLVMLLHYTREAFFFLSVFVAFRSWQARPPTWIGFWLRRFGVILWPYLAWTCIYFAYQMSQNPLSAGPAWRLFGNDLVHGYYQLYFLVVLAQIYVVFPLLVWLVKVTRGHHWWVLGASVAIQLFLTGVSHYAGPSAGPMGTAHQWANALLNSRYLTCYQLFIVAGLLAADHFAQLQQIVRKASGRLLAAAVAIGVATECYYLALVWTGTSPGHASDLFQPVAMVWFGTAIVGLYCLGYRWARRQARRGPTGGGRFVTWGSNVSGGVYLSHVLILELVLSGLGGARGGLPWWVISIILFVTTLIGSSLLVTVIQRTPLRRVLTGPDRPAQRDRLGIGYGGSRADRGPTDPGTADQPAAGPGVPARA